eukprot:CAMPEP_0184860058 /NCGR_PEP_ID=MMETSP0580-20130426/5016_1 /TAXON_ID=1118495 /ORGANISM="Dactyliosolen fragilissimus" /LENGTH=432 /DNA_ID=CAMNT_0027357015 /DNA_START=128 /DNA_END=1423 /DNA_ORIENTATION=+
MMQFRPRQPLYGGKLANEKRRARDGRECLDAQQDKTQVVEVMGKKRMKRVKGKGHGYEDLVGGGPIESAIRLDLIDFRHTWLQELHKTRIKQLEKRNDIINHADELDNHHDTLGNAFRSFKAIFRSMGMGMLHHAKCIPPRVDREAYVQIVYSAAISLLDRVNPACTDNLSDVCSEYDVNASSKIMEKRHESLHQEEKDYNPKMGNDKIEGFHQSNESSNPLDRMQMLHHQQKNQMLSISNNRLSMLENGAFAIFTLFSLIETNPLQHVPHPDLSNHSSSDMLPTAYKDNTNVSSGHRSDSILSSQEMEALSALPMNLIHDDYNPRLQHRRAYWSPVRVDRDFVWKMQILRDSALEIVCDCRRRKYIIAKGGKDIMDGEGKFQNNCHDMFLDESRSSSNNCSPCSNSKMGPTGHGSGLSDSSSQWVCTCGLA